MNDDKNFIERFSVHFGMLLGTTPAFIMAMALFMAWLLLTDLKDVAAHPRLFVVELTGLFIFVHLFLVQRMHNKDIRALHIKLDEIIASLDGANNELIKAEQAPEKVIDELHAAYKDLADNVPHQSKPISVDQNVFKKRGK